MKILVTDDLKSVGKHLNKSINWKRLGISEVLFAYNGKECLEILSKHNPDILLLDIKMPILNGIEVLKKIAEGYYMPRTIIISAYDEFSYAQEAIRYGAVDYILKPIDTDKLVVKIEREIKEQIEVYLKILRNGFLNIQESNVYENVPSILQKLNFSEKIFCILYNTNKGASNYKAREYLDGLYAYHMDISKDSRIYICSLNGNSFEETKDELYKNMLQLVEVDEMISISAIMEISENCLGNAYNQCLDAMNIRFYVPGNIFLYKETEFTQKFDADKIVMYKQRLVQCALDSYNPNLMDAIVEELFDEFVDCMLNYNVTIDICYNILYYVINYLFLKGSIKDYGEFGRQLLKELKQIKKINMLKMKFVSVLRVFITEEISSNESIYQIIEHVKQYLSKNFSQTLSLETISKEFYISKYELCRKFKMIEGMNVWEYIKHVRMENAKLMLLNTDFKIYEIAEKVGYNDSTYFSSIFKKYFNESPKKYRNN